MTSNKMSKAAIAKAAKGGNTLAFIRDAGAEYIAATKAGERATVRATYATLIARRAGIILAGRNNSHPDAMTTEKFAGEFGVESKSIVTLWADLATYVELGGDVDSERFGHLVQYGVSGEVRDAIRADDATLAKVEKAFLLKRRPDGSLRTEGKRAKHGGKRTARPNDGSKSADVTKGKGLAAAVESDALAVALSAVTMLSAACKRLDAEQWATVESAVQKIVTREVTTRTHAAKRDAEKKARASTTKRAVRTRKAAAKKAAA